MRQAASGVRPHVSDQPFRPDRAYSTRGRLAGVISRSKDVASTPPQPVQAGAGRPLARSSGTGLAADVPDVMGVRAILGSSLDDRGLPSQTIVATEAVLAVGHVERVGRELEA